MSPKACSGRKQNARYFDATRYHTGPKHRRTHGGTGSHHSRPTTLQHRKDIDYCRDVLVGERQETQGILRPRIYLHGRIFLEHLTELYQLPDERVALFNWCVHLPGGRHISHVRSARRKPAWGWRKGGVRKATPRSLGAD